MPGIEEANGHRASGVLPILQPPPLSGPRPKGDELPFDLEKALAAVRPLRSAVPRESHTARSLGTEREGNAVLIDDDGLLLTIGYLVVEATDVIVSDEKGHPVPAQVVGYDHQTGFGLIRAVNSLGIEPIQLASTAAPLRDSDRCIIAAQGGLEQAISGKVASRREFAGSWEYLLDEAIFTTPLHTNWSGSGLISNDDGRLLGIGSLFVQDAVEGGSPEPGNMFVPIDLLTPILDDLLSIGRPAGAPRPWLGMHTTEALEHLLVAGTHDQGPADRAGIEPGDLIRTVDGDEVFGLAEMYRRMWSVGYAGVDIRFGIQRDADALEIVIESGDRREYLALPRRH